MIRRARLVIVAAFAAALLIPSAGLGEPAPDQQSIDAQIAELQAVIDSARARESVLTTDLAAAAEQIDLVAAEVDALAARLESLEGELAAQRTRLSKLRSLYAEQTSRLRLLERAERVAQERLEERLVDLYQTGQSDELEILFLVSSLDELISQLDYLDQIARQDQQIATSVATARAEVAAARSETVRIKADQQRTTALLAARTAEQRSAYDALVTERGQLLAAQADRRALIAGVRSGRGEAAEDLEELELASARLAAQIRATSSAAVAPSGSPGPVAESAAGFVSPVGGPITSGYGPRWGRLHAGIDIAAGFGTPIAAAAAGTVIQAGWFGGYGNLVVIDHGGGITTAYAHQQRIYVSVGQTVAQGVAIGETGSTGNSTGPHVHFEVRVNGNAVDPLGYL